MLLPILHLAYDKRMFNDIPQFSDIAWPIMIDEILKRYKYKRHGWRKC